MACISLVEFPGTFTSPRAYNSIFGLMEWLRREVRSVSPRDFGRHFPGFTLWVHLEDETGNDVLTLHGEFDVFPSGPQRKVRKSRVDGRLEMHLYIPRDWWFGVQQMDFVSCLAEQLHECFQILIRAAERRGFLDDREKLERFFVGLLSEFRKHAVQYVFKRLEIHETDRLWELRRQGKIL
jgi:hypothetical protein